MPTYYCAWADVEKKLSRAGAALRTDDWPQVAQADVLDEATQYVAGYLGLIYPAAALVASRWVRQVTAIVGVFFASTRRGNPAPQSIQAAFERWTALLEKMQKLELRLPDAPLNKGFAPVLSNQRVRQWPVSEVKTVQQTSTGNPENYTQHVDQWDQIDYGV